MCKELFVISTIMYCFTIHALFQGVNDWYSLIIHALFQGVTALVWSLVLFCSLQDTVFVWSVADDSLAQVPHFLYSYLMDTVNETKNLTLSDYKIFFLSHSGITMMYSFTYLCMWTFRGEYQLRFDFWCFCFNCD